MSIPKDHPYDFDPTYGLALDDLRAIRPPPEVPGFDAFWQARYRKALAVDPNPSLTRSAQQHGKWIVHDLSYTSTDGFRIGGWLLVPHHGTVERGLVVGHGYGGCDQPDLDLPVENTAILFPCFRGLSRSSRAPISPDPAWHVLHDIDKSARYIIGGCVEDVWTAVTVLNLLFPGTKDRVGYSGASLGGGIGALAIPFDRRIDRGHLTVPTFGNRPLWLALPTIGSARAVQAYGRTHPEVGETLRLFDAATAAARIAVPLLCAVARFDPAVAPPCQFTIANALPAENHHETFILDAGHFDYPGQAAQASALRAKVGKLFRTP
ncbi:deacetylase [Rhizobium sp. Leaf384]|uniref:acetylxylan esterase n=1 Tax=unclassified Rhizobium TaxID=2613769 RepID=UPI0007158EA0|nr:MULTISPECIES: acetylxylan esterase [unclassified Rhizobium]KQS76933.1 deacetylase [Rhizobium sp. Leaf384]KQS78204.1 deacetylase [Rhizobium sp. Leaf383]